MWSLSLQRQLLDTLWFSLCLNLKFCEVRGLVNLCLEWATAIKTEKYKTCVCRSFQPPPVITDKQLDEREHTVEEWKGRKNPLFLLFSLISCHKYLSVCAMCCVRLVCVHALLPVKHLILILKLICMFSGKNWCALCRHVLLVSYFHCLKHVMFITLNYRVTNSVEQMC